MTNVIRFPSVGLEFTINRVAFTIGPFTVYWYGIIIALGFLLAVWYATYLCKKIGLKSDDLIDLLIFAVPIAIIGARAYYVLFNYDKLYYYDHAAMFRIWDGGLAIYGGIIFAVLTGVVFARIKHIRIGSLLDIGAMGFLIGQAVGRWGNFVNAEAFGTETDSFLRMEITNLDTLVTQTVHPTFLYESLWNVLGFILLHFYFKHRKFNGEIFLLYTAWYGLGRGVIEGMRTDSLYLFDTGLRVSQLLGFLSCIVAVAVLIYMYLFVDREAQVLDTAYYEKKPKHSEKAEQLSQNEEDGVASQNEEIQETDGVASQNEEIQETDDLASQDEAIQETTTETDQETTEEPVEIHTEESDKGENKDGGNSN